MQQGNASRAGAAAIRRRVRCSARHLACTWLGGRCGVSAPAPLTAAVRVSASAAALPGGAPAAGSRGPVRVTFRDERSDARSSNRPVCVLAAGDRQPPQRAKTNVLSHTPPSRCARSSLLTGLPHMPNSGRCTLVYLCAGPDTAIANSSSPPVLGSRLPILRGRRSHFVRPVLGAQNSRLWPGSISGSAIGVRAITNYGIADTGVTKNLSSRVRHCG